ncbi:hypothetical protein K4L44_03900 [Halosquirtibacter laminarini]|uniref:Uncharacterized protein n=1 Tax=Halosquirtibacter laminarini TaxID=3374600 RepID=A0AC61NH51_9BACT|nr:hypothetical protein K4L44_03900 [Prolixibacteraceae bacterium]
MFKFGELYSDEKRLRRQFIEETGILVWLNIVEIIYWVIYQYSNCFSIDLHRIAKSIMDDYDPNYKFLDYSMIGFILFYKEKSHKVLQAETLLSQRLHPRYEALVRGVSCL